MEMYEKRNEAAGAAGAGGWIIKETEVLRRWPGEDKRNYNARVLVKLCILLRLLCSQTR